MAGLPSDLQDKDPLRGRVIGGGDLMSDEERLSLDRNECFAVEEINGYLVRER